MYLPKSEAHTHADMSQDDRDHGQYGHPFLVSPVRPTASVFHGDRLVRDHVRRCLRGIAGRAAGIRGRR